MSSSVFVAIYMIVIYIWFVQGLSGSLLPKNESSSEVLITNKMIDIFSKNHPNIVRTAVILYGYLPSYFYDILAQNPVDTIVMNPMKENSLNFTIPLPGDSTENYVQYRVGMIFLYVYNFTELAEAFMTITQTIYWSADAKIVVYTIQKNYKALIFYFLWWYKSVDCILLEVNEESSVIVYRYSPYIVNVYPENSNLYGCWSDIKADELFEGNMETFVHCNKSCNGLDKDKLPDLFLQTCIEISIVPADIKGSVFPGVITDLQGYTLSVLAIPNPPVLEIDETKEGSDMFTGKDGKLLNVLSQKMNFTFKYKKHIGGGTSKFTIFLSGFFDLAYRRYDISVNVLYLVPYSFPMFELMYPVEGSGLCFLVHRANRIPTWINLSRIYDGTTILMLLSLFHVIVVNNYFFIKYSRKMSTLDCIGLSYMYALQLFLYSPMHWISRQNFHRFVITIVFWFIFVMNFLFQGLIISFLTVPKFGNEIDTFEDLIESGFNIEGLPSPDAFLPSETSEVFDNINKRFKKSFELFSCVNDIKNTSGKGCWMDCRLADTVQKSFRDPNGNLALHIGTDMIHNHYLTFPMMKDSPLMYIFDHYCRMIGESGLMKKWRDSIVGPAVDKMKYHIVDSVVLKINDLQGCFFLLLVGLILSACVFIIELLLKQRVMGKKRKNIV